MEYSQLNRRHLADLRKIIPPDRFIYPPSRHYDHDQFKAIRSLPDLVLQPKTNEEISRIMAYANRAHLPVTVRGNSTGLMGGNIAIDHGIALDMIKMNKILNYDPDNLTITVQSGVRVVDINQFLIDKPFTYVPAPAMKWACIGGNAATNAGGMRVIKYGTTREHIRGIKTVLADGTVFQFGHQTAKNSSGYDLKDLVLGSEGTLAVITELILRLFPRPKVELQALVPFNNVNQAISVVPKILAAGLLPVNIEFFSRAVISNWEKYANKKFITAKGGGFLLIGFNGNNRQAVEDDLKTALSITKDLKALEAIILSDQKIYDQVWEARNNFLTVIQQSTPMMDEVDIVVPINKIPNVLDAVETISQEETIRLPNFGHAGDGNLHIYICSDQYNQKEFQKKSDQVIKKLYQTAKSYGGEMSGEHGTGYARKDYFQNYYGKDYVQLLQKVKRAFDPELILNPEKIFPITLN